MKKIISIVFMFFIYALFGASFISAEENTDLPVYEEGISQHNYNSSALTDLYDIALFTEAGEVLFNKIFLWNEISNKTTSEVLKLDGSESEYINISSENLNAPNYIFTQSNLYSKTESSTEKSKISIVFTVVIFVCLSVIGFFAALALKKVNSGRKNVYNNYSKKR